MGLEKSFLKIALTFEDIFTTCRHAVLSAFLYWLMVLITLVQLVKANVMEKAHSSIKATHTQGSGWIICLTGKVQRPSQMEIPLKDASLKAKDQEMGLTIGLQGLTSASKAFFRKICLRRRERCSCVMELQCRDNSTALRAYASRHALSRQKITSSPVSSAPHRLHRGRWSNRKLRIWGAQVHQGQRLFRAQAQKTHILLKIDKRGDCHHDNHSNREGLSARTQA